MSLPGYEKPDLPPESFEEVDSDLDLRPDASPALIFGSGRVIVLVLLLLVLSLLAGLFGSSVLSQFAQLGP